jgi:hypothetical protein
MSDQPDGDALSARDVLLEAFVDAMQDANWHMTAGEDYEKSTALIDAFAHQLAEQQRAEWATIRSLITNIHSDDVNGIIDLIDPEATE